MSNKEVVSRECRFVTHIYKTERTPDIHIIKETVTFKDGTREPNVRIVKDFKRKYYLTKKRFRNHKQKKEIEEFNKLDSYTTTQSNMNNSINKHLRNMHGKVSYRQLTSSPYLYGSDVSSTSIIKDLMIKKNNGKITPYSVGSLDIETDVLNGTEEVVIMSVTAGNTTHIGILEKLIKSEPDARNKFFRILEEQLGDVLREHHHNVVLDIEKDEYEVMKKPIDTAHRVKPDFLATWNINFDYPYMEKRCKHLGKNIALLFKDPILPNSLARYRYLEGQTKMITDSGVVKSLAPSAQWHSVITSASFTPICSMSTYRQLRLAKAEEPSYSYDAIATKVLGKGKVRIEEAEHLSGLDWHVFMQRFYPLEYAVYAVWDSLGIVLMDKKTKDLSVTLPIEMRNSDFRYVKKRTKRTDDNAYFHQLKKRNIVGTLGKTKDEEKLTVSVLPLSGWIITVPAYKQVAGAQVIKEYPKMRTNIRLANWYNDIISAYPNGIISLNVSKGTTQREICYVSDTYKDSYRLDMINNYHGAINSITYCINIYGIDSPDAMVEKLVSRLNERSK